MPYKIFEFDAAPDKQTTFLHDAGDVGSSSIGCTEEGCFQERENKPRCQDGESLMSS